MKKNIQGLCQKEVVVRKLVKHTTMSLSGVLNYKLVKVKAKVTIVISQVKKPNTGQQNHRN